MTDNTAPVGIFDSGVGGLTVTRSIIDQLPDEEIIYVGDTAHGPYGPLTITVASTAKVPLPWTSAAT